MADNTVLGHQSIKGELREDGSQAAQKKPQPGAQPLRPALMMGIRSDGDAPKDSDNPSAKSGVSKGTSAYVPFFVFL